MPEERINLLPPERRRMLSREYLIRLSIVAVMLATVLAVIAALLLLPAYVFLTTNIVAKEARLANIESTLSSSDEVALSARITALSNDAAALAALEDAPSASASIRTVLAIARPGIILSGLTFSSGVDKKPSVLAVSGRAATRDALRRYQIELQNAPAALSADLPVSAYAKDSDIAFTITMTLSL